MSWFADSANHRPLSHWSTGKPIWLVTLVAIGAMLGMVLTAIFGQWWLQVMPFSVAAVRSGQFWTPLTYWLATEPSIWAVVSAYFMVGFGSSVEQHLGRRSTTWLMLATVLLQPLVIAALAAVTGESGVVVGFLGLGFALFIAFATLYPNAEINLILCRIPAWITAVVIVGITFLSYLMARDVPGMIQSLAPAALAYFWVKRENGSLCLPKRLFQRKPPPRGPPQIELDLSLPMAQRYERPVDDWQRVDAILDKISEKGMHSLTDEEKKLLERHSRIAKKRKER